MATCVQGHTAFIYDRGGKRRIGPLIHPSMVQWSRTRDATSEAAVRIEGSACSDQAPFLSMIHSHRHELVIYRGTKRVWEGPVHRVAWHANYVEITAHDITEYLKFTPLTKIWSNADLNADAVSSRIGEIIEYEMTHGRSQMVDGVTVAVPAWESIDPPANVVDYVQVHNFVNEARTAMTTYPYEMTVGEHLQSLARYQGIDFTTVGRALHIWDVSRALGRTLQLTEANFHEEIIITEYGADHAQSAYVLGNPPPDDPAPVYGSALTVGNLDYYGPWTAIYTPYDESASADPQQSELNSQAQRNLAGRSPAPIEVRVPDNSGLTLDDSVTIDDLVPGVQVPLRATLNSRTYSQMQKFDTITVRETGSEGEIITVTLVPITRPDADDELPDDNDQVQGAFPLNPNYVLRATAMDSGTSFAVKATVYRVGPPSTGVKKDGATFTLVGERLEGTNITKSGTWDFDFNYYTSKTVAIMQVDDVAAGVRDFSVTVDMGAGIGALTLSGTVQIG